MITKVVSETFDIEHGELAVAVGDQVVYQGQVSDGQFEPDRELPSGNAVVWLTNASLVVRGSGDRHTLTAAVLPGVVTQDGEQATLSLARASLVSVQITGESGDGAGVLGVASMGRTVELPIKAGTGRALILLEPGEHVVYLEAKRATPTVVRVREDDREMSMVTVG